MVIVCQFVLSLSLCLYIYYIIYIYEVNELPIRIQSLVYSFRFCFTRAVQWYSVSSSQCSALALLQYFLFILFMFITINRDVACECCWFIQSMYTTNQHIAGVLTHCSAGTQYRFIEKLANTFIICKCLWFKSTAFQVRKSYQQYQRFSAVNTKSCDAKRQFVESSLICEFKKDSIKSKNLSLG